MGFCSDKSDFVVVCVLKCVKEVHVYACYIIYFICQAYQLDYFLSLSILADKNVHTLLIDFLYVHSAVILDG